MSTDPQVLQSLPRENLIRAGNPVERGRAVYSEWQW